MPRRLLIRGAQPLIPCTPLSRYRRYKSPCRAIFCSLIFLQSTAAISLTTPPALLETPAPTSLLFQQRSSPPRTSLLLRSSLPLVSEHYSSTGTALPLSYLLATVEISLESPRVIAGSSGGSTPVSTYQTDNNNSSSQSSRTHLLDRVYRATTLCAHSKPLRQQRARRRPFLPTYLMCM